MDNRSLVVFRFFFFFFFFGQVDSGAGPSGALAVSMTWEKGDIGILPLLFPSLPH
jgi:hypothetical protein